MIELVDVRLDHPRGGTPLVSNGNLRVACGEVAMVVGAAGVGTSRMVAAALGDYAMGAGRIEVLGHDVAKLRRSSLRLLRRKVGIVPQDLCLLEDRSAQVNVALPLEIDGIPRSISICRSIEILAKLGLEDEASLPIDCLSIAARQRVAVARALVREPELVIADHPTMWQDAAGAELVCAALADIAATGSAVLVFGRDHALRTIAERRQWRQLALIDGMLKPLGEVLLDGLTIEELLLGMESVPAKPQPQPESIPNLVPFPLSARTAGVA
jgi:ABC-type ATPase involved in cell division